MPITWCCKCNEFLFFSELEKMRVIPSRKFVACVNSCKNKANDPLQCPCQILTILLSKCSILPVCLNFQCLFFLYFFVDDNEDVYMVSKYDSKEGMVMEVEVIDDGICLALYKLIFSDVKNLNFRKLFLKMVFLTPKILEFFQNKLIFSVLKKVKNFYF